MSLDEAAPWKPFINKDGTPSAQAKILACGAFEACAGGIVGGGKRLSVDTPIPTPFGWTTMGALRVGDEVFDCDGRPTCVTFVSDVEHNPDAWELRFEDGSALRCDADHQWLTSTLHERAQMVMLTDEWRAQRKAKRQRRGPAPGANPKRSAAIARRNETQAHVYKTPPNPRGSVKTTRQILDTFRAQGRINHAIENPLPLDLPSVPLPIDPYCLGAWLGDGSTTGGVMHGLDDEVFAAFTSAGYEVVQRKNPVTRGIRGLQRDLKIAGVFDNKHIPQRYLRASIDQRIALLQGLCDTDGYAEKDKGSIEFTTTKRALRDGMMELLASLGIKASCGEGRATLYGRDISAKWRITFRTSIPCFRIARKIARQKRDGFRGPHGRRYIVDAVRTPPEPMRCISVAAPSGTYLAGREMIVTHNTSALLAGPLRWVHRNGFAALLLRRNYTDLTKADGLIERAAGMYRAVGGESHNGGIAWTWPSGARIDLAGMDREEDRFKYDGSAYQFVAFDQLETFTERQYTYLASRMRQNDRILADGGEPIPLRLRSSATPGGPHPDWVIARFAPWIRAHDPTWTGYRAQDGERLSYRFDEVRGEQVICEADHPDARSRAYFSTELIEELVGKEYVLSLDTLDPLTRAQRKFGNWLIRPGAGLFFTAESFTFIDAPPLRVRARARAWDLASTPKKPGDADSKGAATAGVLGGITLDGDVFVEDVVRVWERPGTVEDLVVETCFADDDRHGEFIRMSLPLDPGQAARHQRDSYARRLQGRNWSMTPEVGEKTNRIKPISAHASRRPIRLVRGPWNDAFTTELIAFPFGLKDQGDAFSRMYAECLRQPTAVVSRHEPRSPNAPGRRPLAGGFGRF